MHRMLVEDTPLELSKPKIEPKRFFDNALSKSSGILVGTLLGVVAWIAIVALALAVWRGLS